MGSRKPKLKRHTVSTLSLLSVALATGLLARASDTKPKVGDDVVVKIARSNVSEQSEREVDQVALHAQDNAIAKLNTLLKKYRNSRQESVFLAKLAELQQQRGSILFRIAHSRAHHNGKAIDLSAYNKCMKGSVATLDTLLSKYPDYEEAAHAYFLRGHAYEEIKNKPLATRDYLYLVKHWPHSDETPSAYMSLAEFSIEDNDHARAITYLLEVEKLPNDPHFPFALFKLAWANYNLKNIPRALSYGERHVAYYSARAGKDGTLDTSDAALRENTLLDMAVFYFEGFEETLPQYKLSETLPYFRKLERGPALGRILTRYAKLLRSHSHEATLYAWKDEVLANEATRPESLDVALITYDYQLNRRKYDKLAETAHNLVKLYAMHSKETPTHAYESWPKAQKALIDTAEGLQTLIVKNKGATEVHGLSVTLASIYDAFTHVVEETDPRIPRVHYNLAETLFVIQDYPGATTHYRWVVDHGKWNLDDKSDSSVANASIRAISARYEVLRANGLIPKDLAARALSEDDSKRALDPQLGEWVAWLDKHLSKAPPKADAAASKRLEVETFAFESARSLYAGKHLHEALARLSKFANGRPDSKYAIPSATLVLDTHITSADWKRTHELATDFMEIEAWKSNDFHKRLFTIASDSYYKMIEVAFRTKDFATVLKMSDEFTKRYAKSVRLAETLNLAGNGAVQSGDKTRAVGYFSKLIEADAKSPLASEALLSLAAIHEEQYRFAAAAADYRAYFARPEKERKIEAEKLDGLRRRALMLTWLGGDVAELRHALDSKVVCHEGLAQECEKYAALARLSDPDLDSASSAAESFETSRRSSGEKRTLWAAAALQGAQHLSFRDRLLTVRTVAAGWEEADPLVKFALLPLLSESLPKVFNLSRLAMNQVAPLKADEKHITRRVEAIHEIETAATRVMKLPWSRIRAETMNELATLYLDLSKGLAGLPAPEGLTPADLQVYNDTIQKLVLPFEEKGQDLRAKSFEIASRFAIEDSAFKAISDPFFVENPSQAKSLRPMFKTDKPSSVDFELLSRLDSSGKWSRLPRWDDSDIDDRTESAVRLKYQWVKAVQKRHWGQVAFFMQEAREKNLMSPMMLSAMRSVSLAAAGARGEGLAELEDARKLMAPEQKAYVLKTLLQYALRASARDRTKALLKELPDQELIKEAQDKDSWIAQAVAYTGLQIASADTETGRAPAAAKKQQ